MPISTVRSRVVLTALALVAGVSLSNPAAAQDFTFAVMPDIHVDFPGVQPLWVTLSNYIAAQKSARNIVAVIAVGDATTDGSTGSPWQSIQDGYSVIAAAGIPILSAPGNHDENNQNPPGRLIFQLGSILRSG